MPRKSIQFTCITRWFLFRERVLSGRHVTSRDKCRPAVVMSYLIASFAALLSAFTYAEFAVDLRVAGGAYVYANLVFGELTGWCASFCIATNPHTVWTAQ